MASKESLEPREADCSTADDYLDLAKEALEEPADAEYARDLVEKAEIECQFPAEYVKVAEAAKGAGHGDYAKELYEQAEEACFEAAEFAGLGHSLAAVLGDTEKAREMLEKAAEEAKAIPDYLRISRFAREDLEDEELAKSLLEKVEGDCKTLEDYRSLVRSVLEEPEDAEAARAFYRKAEKYSLDLESTIAYAEGIKEIFDDAEWTAEALEEVESDCRFTKEFVTLAGAYHHLTGDGEKVSELIEQAEEFAMTGEEQVQLAEGCFRLLGDRERAAAAYEKALSEISEPEDLSALASTIANDLEERELAKKVYAKAEEKLTTVQDATKLARAVIADTEDREFAAEVYRRAEERFSSPGEARVLARDVLEVLEDKERAERLFETCLAGTEGFAELGKLLTSVAEGVGSPDLDRAVLEKMAGAGRTPPELLKTADRVAEILGDRAFTARLLDDAEERVASLDEMKSVVDAVSRHLADDEKRVARVAEKLEKREANQDRYDEFQEREKSHTTCRQCLALVDEMMEQLDDRYYAAKLLSRAEESLTEGVYDVEGYWTLVHAIERHLADGEWVERLLDAGADRAGTIAEIRTLCRFAAAELEDREFGTEWARSLLEKQEEELGTRESSSAYDYTKLAGSVFGDLGDKDWASRLLLDAEARAKNHYELTHVARMQMDLGDAAKAGGLFDRAAGTCSTGRECIQLIMSLRALGLSEAEQRKHYERGRAAIDDPRQKLRWAEGILEAFGDERWARAAFVELAPVLSSPADRTRFLASQELHFGKRFC